MAVFGSPLLDPTIAKYLAPNFAAPKTSVANSTQASGPTGVPDIGKIALQTVQAGAAAGARSGVFAENLLPSGVKSVFGKGNLPLPLDSNNQYQPQGLAQSVFGSNAIGGFGNYGKSIIGDITPGTQTSDTANSTSPVANENSAAISNLFYAPIIGLGQSALDITNPIGEGGPIKAIVEVSDLKRATQLAVQLGVDEKYSEPAGRAFVAAKTKNQAEAALTAFKPKKNAVPDDLFMSSKDTEQGLPNRTVPSVDTGTPETPRPAVARPPSPEPVSKSLPETVQETRSKVNLPITGATETERVQSAITNSERVKNEINIRGKDAFAAGQKLSPADLKLAEGYESGMSIEQMAKQAKNPAQFTKFMNKFADYFDFRLAADRAAGGETARIENYIPHNYDLSKPEDLARFNKFAEQRGVRPYDGFRGQPRVFNSYKEGEAAGFKRLNPTILGDLKKDYEGASNAISKQALKQGLGEAAPDKVSMSGTGLTEKGKPFTNSNIPGLEGISYHPTIADRLKGFQPLANKDTFSLIKDSGFKLNDPSTYSKVWDGLKEAGVLNTVGTLYDHASTPMKHFLLNFSGFHSLNISANYAGASLLNNPLKGVSGLATSIPSFFSEGITQKIIDGFKTKMVKGQDFSVFDAGLRAGVNLDRGLAKTGIAKLNPMDALSHAMFDRELYTLKLNLVDQVFSSGKVLPESSEGRSLGKEIEMIMGEMNNLTMNINPNVQKWASRLLLAPQFTESKYAMLGKAVSTNPATSLAARTVIGKSIVMGTLATFGTLLATGKFPNLTQTLLNYTTAPDSQTNITNPKGQKQDISFPQTFISEPARPIAGLLKGSADDLIHYGEARLAPAISDAIAVATNKDYFGNPIIDPNSKQSKLQQYAKNVGEGDLPIGAQALLKVQEGTQTGTQAAINIAGLRTKLSSTDPTAIKYKGIDDAKAAILKIDGNDPQRTDKIQTIFSGLDAAQRKSLNYQLLLQGVSIKGVSSSDTGVLFKQVQSLKQAGKTGEATKIINGLTDAQYKAYTTYKHNFNTQSLRDLLKSDPVKGVDFLRSQDPAEQQRLLKVMTNAEYAQYEAAKI